MSRLVGSIIRKGLKGAEESRLRPVARRFSGRIDCRHDRLGGTGREWFAVTVLAGGDRTVRAHCEMDDERMLRDVVTRGRGAPTRARR